MAFRRSGVRLPSAPLCGPVGVRIAWVSELEDALDSGSSGGNPVEVRVLCRAAASRAPTCWNWQTGWLEGPVPEMAYRFESCRGHLFDAPVRQQVGRSRWGTEAAKRDRL